MPQPAPPAHLLPPQVTIRWRGLFCQITHAQRISNLQPPASHHASARSRFIGKRPTIPGPAHGSHPLICFYHYAIFRARDPPPPPAFRCHSQITSEHICESAAAREWLPSPHRASQALPFSRWPPLFFFSFIRTTAEIPGEVIAVSLRNTCQYSRGAPHPTDFYSIPISISLTCSKHIFTNWHLGDPTPLDPPSHTGL